MTKRFYLDSNILIAYFSVDKSEDGKKEILKGALAVFGKLRGVRLCTSMWTVTETINVLRSAKQMDPVKVAEIENQLIHEQRLGRLKIEFVDVSPRKDYDFKEFFYHVRQGILNHHSGVGDVIHSVIMKNNKIRQILTFDDKNDFKQIPGLTVFHPKNIKLDKRRNY